jgi:Uncharacterized conserved protein
VAACCSCSRSRAGLLLDARHLLPLHIVFIDAGGRIVDAADMQPYSDTLHCPDSAVRYALEVAQGSAARAHLAPGMSVQGLPR